VEKLGYRPALANSAPSLADARRGSGYIVHGTRDISRTSNVAEVSSIVKMINTATIITIILLSRRRAEGWEEGYRAVAARVGHDSAVIRVLFFESNETSGRLMRTVFIAVVMRRPFAGLGDLSREGADYSEWKHGPPLHRHGFCTIGFAE